MAITDTQPASEAIEQVAPKAPSGAPPASARILGSNDHKTIGRLYIFFAMVLGIGAWALQATSTANNIKSLKLLSADSADQIFTLGRLSLVFMFLLPLVVGLATYVVPLQVGAATVAFPRAAATAFWAWLIASITVVVAYVSLNGGVGGGTAKAVDLSYLALSVAIIALLLGTVCVIATVFTMRPKGMTLERIPMFSWGMVVGGSMWLLTLPVLLGNIALIYLDHHFGKQVDFGVADNQWKQLVWAFQQPQAFAFAAPTLGIIGDVVATMVGTRQRNRGLVMAAIGGFAILSFGAWAQDYYDAKLWQRGLFVAVAILIVLPVLALLAAWATTVTRGKARFASPAVFSLLAMVTFVVGVAASVLFVVKPLRLQESVHFQNGLLVLVVGAGMLATLGGLHYWAPKIWGRSPSEGLGRITALIAFVGVLLGGLMLCIRGFGTRYHNIATANNFLNGAAAAGAGLAALALLLTLLNLGLRPRKPDVADDPWGGQTLEWATGSPPPLGNFDDLPVIASPEPVLDAVGSSKEAS